jgi:hypothetical protein
MVVDSNYGNATYTMLNEVAFVGYTHRQTILPVDYSSNNEFSAGVGARTIQPGLYGTAAQTPDTVTGLRHTGSGWTTAANAVNPYIQYDLGGQYNLSALKIYNGALSGQYNRGVQQLDIQVSNDGSTWTDAAMNQTLAQTTGTGAEWQTVPFTANDYRYVRLTVDSNYGNTYTEIAKVQFSGTAASGQQTISADSASTTMGEFSSSFALANTYNLTGIRTTSDMANSTANDAGAYNWISANGSTTGEVVWSFDTAVDLQSMLVWNGNDGVNANRGVNQYDLLVSKDNGDSWVTVATDDNLVLTSNSDIWLGPEGIAIGQDGVTDVKMVVDSNHGDASYTMINEVAFVSGNVQETAVFTGGVPTNLTATAAATNQIDLSWSAALEADGYNVKRASSSGGPYTTIATPVATNWSDTGLTDNTAWYYVVSATNATGESEESTEANATTYSIPIASNLAVDRPASQTLKIHPDQLIAVCSDPAGRALGVSSVATLSDSNQTVTAGSPWIVYSPATDFLSDDRFSFSITNSVGVAAQGQVLITVIDDETTLDLAITPDGNGDVSMTLNGIPGNMAVVQATSNLVSGVWADLQTNTFNGAGYFEFSETNAPSPRYYRLRSHAE